jgi:hypothetical protein
MGRPLKIKKLTDKDIGFNSFDQLTNAVFPATLTPADFFGVVGGLGSVASAQYPVVECTVNIAGSGENDEDGVIIRQKGATKYLVRGVDSGAVAVCTLVNKATPAAGEMSIGFATGGDSTLKYVKRITNKWALDYDNVRYLTNFFTDEGTQIKSGTANTTVALAQIESTAS